MPVSPGSLSASHSMIHCCTLGQWACTPLMMGRKVVSKQMILSSAWLTIQAICSGSRRGLMVCSTRSEPLTPKYSSRWR